MLNGVRKYTENFLRSADVYLLFDKYKKYSIKSDTRAERLGRIRRAFTLSSGSPLPSKDVALKTTATKVQLITLIANDLLSFFLNSERKIVVTASEDCPEESHLGEHRVRTDMRTSHEEADVLIPQQVSHLIRRGIKCLKVICDDTDVFVLLCHFYSEEKWASNVFMESFSADKSLICFKSSVNRHQDIVPYILSAHAFGCDCVPSLFGVGKKTVIKALRKRP